MPLLQFEPVVLALVTAIALDCTIPPWSRFDRKHYFYPDLPSGFQITQSSHPLARDGGLTLFNWYDLSTSKTIRIAQVQLEQDTGKSFHHSGRTFVDYNRAGMPLMEIVTHPDIRSPQEAADAVKTLQSLLRTLGTSDAQMEEGSLRVDVNISLATSTPSSRDLIAATERVEIKNISTVSGLTAALEYEIHRQTNLFVQGNPGRRETRGFDASSGCTYVQRVKESTQDYRYISDAEIPRVFISSNDVSRIQAVIPELPQSRFARMTRQFPVLSPDQISWLLNTRPDPNTKVETQASNLLRQRYLAAAIPDSHPLLETFSHTTNMDQDTEPPWPTAAEYLISMQPRTSDDVRTMYNWLANDVIGRIVTRRDLGNPLQLYGGWGIKPTQLASIVYAISIGKISGKVGKLILDMMMDGDTRTALTIAEEHHWIVVTDVDQIKQWAQHAITITPRKPHVSDTKYATWLVGQVMTTSKGRANPSITRQIVNELVCGTQSPK